MTLVPVGATAQPPPEHGAVRNVTEMKLAVIPGLPTCVQGSPQSGDPGSSGFIIYAKAKAGCTIPWHWHSANERVIMVSGTARMSMRAEAAMDENAKADMKGDAKGDAKGDSAPVTLRAGGFVEMPAKHVHQLRCNDTCTFYVLSDGKFDIHYIDPDGKEIPPEQAMKPLNQTVATAPPVSGPAAER
jgi:quercetin dioxygenase-like cupin family protein